jgi:2-dehydropantoate 2-reductase
VKVLIAGAGATGGYIGACMARVGEDVTLFARGPHLRAMQVNGLRVRDANGEFAAHPTVIGNLSECGPVDVIFLGVKAHSLIQLAPQIKFLIKEHVTVVSMQNGVPWWYFQFGSAELTGTPLERVDPGGVIRASIDPKSVVGSIVYFSTEIIEPGVIRHVSGNRITLGEPDGTRSERCRKISEGLVQSGLRCPITTQLRSEIWVKLLGNTAFNPISALTRATIAQMLRDPEVSILVRAIMQEVEAVANKLGIELPVSIDQRIAGAEKVGEHKTSMLQDLEAGRPLEIEAVVGAVIEIAQRLGVSVPRTQAVYACTKLLECTSSKRT